MANLTYVIDVDGTICESPIIDGRPDYENAKPNQKVIDMIQKLWQEGNRIVLFTSRNVVYYRGDMEKIQNITKPKLIKWLVDHGVYYNDVIMGKPVGDDTVYIDDKMLTINQFISSVNVKETFAKNKDMI